MTNWAHDEPRTWGELKQWAEENGVADDTEIWVGDTVVEGGLDYPEGYRSYHAHVHLADETFGIALPKDRQVTKTGMVIW